MMQLASCQRNESLVFKILSTKQLRSNYLLQYYNTQFVCIKTDTSKSIKNYYFSILISNVLQEEIIDINELKKNLKSFAPLRFLASFYYWVKSKWIITLLVIIIVSSFCAISEFCKPLNYSYNLTEDSRYFDNETVSLLINSIANLDSISFLEKTGLPGSDYSVLKHIVSSRSFYRIDWYKYEPNEVIYQEIDSIWLKIYHTGIYQIGNEEIKTSTLIDRKELENSLKNLFENSLFVEPVKKEYIKYLKLKQESLIKAYSEAFINEEEGSPASVNLTIAMEKALFDIKYQQKNTENFYLFFLSNPRISNPFSLSQVILSSIIISITLLFIGYLFHWFRN